MDATEQENVLREVNTDTFILRCNQELVRQDPHFAAAKGLDEEMVTGGNDITQQTPEEMAAQEAERERILQESRQAEVINSVMRRIEGNLQEDGNKMTESLEVIKIDLNQRFADQQTSIAASISNLEKYLDDVHK